jgi:hypothetical protein
MERIKNRFLSDITEFFFDDDLELHIMVKNKSPSNYPFKILHFNDLETDQKRIITKVLRIDPKTIIL